MGANPGDNTAGSKAQMMQHTFLVTSTVLVCSTYSLDTIEGNATPTRIKKKTPKYILH